jgi:hypothetical protein
MASGFEFHDDLLPIALLTTTRTLTYEDAAEIFDYYKSLCSRRIKFVAVSDVRAAKEMPDARTRKEFGEQAARFEAQSRLWSRGSVVVVGSELIRGALTAIQWIARPATPMTYFSDMGAAIDWAVAQLERDGAEITPAITAFRRKLGSRGEVVRVSNEPARSSRPPTSGSPASGSPTSTGPSSRPPSAKAPLKS